MILLLSVLFGRRMSVQSTLGNVLEFTGEFKNRSFLNIGNTADTYLNQDYEFMLTKKGLSENYLPVA